MLNLPRLRRIACSLLFSSVAVGLAACSSTEEADAEAEIAEGAASSATIQPGRTRSFSGNFRFRTRSGTGKFDFEVSRIDWTAKTARWDATVVAGDGLTNDVGLPMEVLVARCPGCFVINARENGALVVSAEIAGGRLTRLRYFGQDVTPVVAEISDAPDGPLPGSCVLICEGRRLACSDGGDAASCKASRFSSVPRCIYEVTFEPRSCAEGPSSNAQ